MYYVLAIYLAYMFLICGVKLKGNNHAKMPQNVLLQFLLEGAKQKKIAIAMIAIFTIYRHYID